MRRVKCTVTVIQAKFTLIRLYVLLHLCLVVQTYLLEQLPQTGGVRMDRNGEFFIEMARDETHGGGSWSFQSCVFAPTEKRGGGEWKFWSTIGEVKPGDVILHLRGKPPNAQFVGYSLAASGGRRTDSKPPDAGAWSYSGSYFKADLTDFTPFQPVINLADVFKSREQELREYFAANRSLADEKLPIFFVVQSDRLQCLNGAYFSKGDNNLLEALFGDDHSVGPIASAEGQANVNTGEGVATLRTRIGQRDFSLAVKANYSNRCCFPNCPIDDPRFLVASHIARWSDTPSLRGNLRNGL